MQFILSLIPLLVIVILLFKKKHMLFAGLVGGILTIIIGKLGMSEVNSIFLESIKNMLGIIVPILYASVAAMVSKAGSIEALVEIANRGLKGKINILAGIIILIQGFATYMAGTGAGNTMVIAPIALAAVGVIPEIIGAMSIITAVGFTTSPTSTETIIAAQSANVDVITHSSNMLPYTIFFYLFAACLAIYGVTKRKSILNESNSNFIIEEKSSKLLKMAIPAVVLLLMVVLGKKINSFSGYELVTPLSAVLLTCILTVICTNKTIDDVSDSLIDGSKFLLTTLFSVGIFLSFINMMQHIGTFNNIASLASKVPTVIVLPTAIILAFLIAIPSGAFTAGVLALILPTLSVLGLPSVAMGLVAIATGLGTQISPVQINVSALAKGFEQDIIDIIKYNMKFIITALFVVIVFSIIFVR